MKESTPFLSAFSITMQREGRYSFDRLDPGGETYCGISRVYWPDWPGWEQIDRAADNKRDLSTVIELPVMVKKFYRQQFWNRFRGDEIASISEPVAAELFDTAVNLGVHIAVKYLQQALNLLNINQKLYPDILDDGLIGKITISTLKLFLSRRPMSKDDKEKMLLNVMNCLQGMHYIEQMRKFPERERFRGWFLRV